MRSIHHYLFIGLIWLLPVFLFGQDHFHLLQRPPEYIRELEQLLENQQLDSLEQVCRQWITTPRNRKRAGFAHFYLGEVFAADDNYTLASIEYKLANEQFRGYPEGKALALLKLGNIRFQQDSLEEVAQLLQEALQLSAKNQLHHLQIEIHQQLALLYTAQSRFDLSVGQLKQALDLANTDSLRIPVLTQLATHFHAEGNLGIAADYYEQLIASRRSDSSSVQLISDLRTYGQLCIESGKLERALQLLLEARDLAQQTIGDNILLLELHTEIAKLFIIQRDYRQALEYSNRALPQARKFQMHLLVAENAFLSGISYQELDSTRLAIQTLEEALMVYRTLNHSVGIASVQIELSELYSSQAQLSEAETALKEALALRQGSTDQLGLQETRLHLANLQLRQKRSAEAIDLLNAVLKNSINSNHKPNQQKALELLSAAYTQQGDYATALRFFQEAMAVRDSVQSLEISKNMDKIRVEYQTKELQDSLVFQQAMNLQQQQINQQQKRNYYLTVILLCVPLILTGLLAGFYYFLNKKNKQLSRQQMEVLRKEQEARQLRALIEGEEKERKRVARDLHDGLGALLATVKMQINSIENKLPDVKHLPTYKKAEELIDDACRSVREISHDMMPYVLEQQGLEYALRDMCVVLSNRYGMQVTFLPYELEFITDDTLKVTVYRIVQELLKNAVKHADASSVMVQLQADQETISLTVEDDGQGFNPNKIRRGIGLDNIRSRVEYLDGIFEIDSSPGQGSAFIINIPIKTIPND